MKNLFILLYTIIQSIAFAGTPQEILIPRPDGSSIITYLQTPMGSKSFSIAVVLQGSECRSVYKSALSGGELFLSLGIARLDIEKYGLNKSSTTCTQSYLDHNTIVQRIQDYLRVFQIIRKDFPGWNQQLFLIGGSEGAIIAPSIAAFTPEVTKLVLLSAGGGITMRANQLMRQENELKKIGTAQSDIDKALQSTSEQMDTMMINPVSTQTWAGATNTYLWWSSILNFLPLTYLIDMNIPIYLAHGDADTSFLIASSRKTVSAFTAAGKKNIFYKEYPGLDHHWLDTQGKSHTTEVIQDFLNWIQAPNY